MGQVLIRPASLQDLPALLRLEQGVVSAERPFDPTLKDGTIHYCDIAQMLADDHVRFLVALVDADIVGCGFARIELSKPYLTHARHAYLGLMFVAPAYRGCGINGKIIDELKRWCHAQKVAELRLEVYHGNQSAVKAYEKQGFVKHIVEMRESLTD